MMLQHCDRRTFRFQYIVESDFSLPVTQHFFKLRVTPMQMSSQRVLDHSVCITPTCTLLKAADSFGNTLHYGAYNTPHSVFRVESRGCVECSSYAVCDDTPADCYLYPTALTASTRQMHALLHADDTPDDLMLRVHEYLTYTRFVSDNTTSAQDTFRSRQGVCQDYAHLMIALCRAAGLRARYANGLMTGEGETHAWVEVHDGKAWLGYDPTLNRRIDFGYIKLAHGRDVADCPSNRGRFYGVTTEFMSVQCKTQQL